MGDELSPSIMEYFGSDSGHRCGYCKNSKSNLSHGMWAHMMTVSDYEALINRGWRRSGQYCYKPIMSRTCCPQYTIRCDAMNFQLNHSHKKVLRKVKKYLNEKYKDADSNMASDVTMQDQSIGNNQDSTTVKQKPKKATDGGPKSLEDHIAEESLDACKSLDLKLISTSSHEFKDTLQESYNLYVKYQVKIHEDEPEECSLDQYKRFLVKSPLQAEHDCPIPTGYGSFHQQYRLDGKLVAVGVIDILPSCLSSVYFYYDPEYSFLSLGTYGALRELEFVRRLTKSDPKFHWYYMGFYIHSCPKMKYKGQFNPSYLLCPEAFTWHPIKPCFAKLDAKKYSRLNEDDTVKDEKPSFSEISILHKRRIMSANSYAAIRSKNTDDSEQISEYANLVGKYCAKKMLLYRS